MSTPFVSSEETVISAATGTTVGNNISVDSYEYIDIMLDVTGSTTTKFLGSISSTAPDFDAAQSATNAYDNLAFADLQVSPDTYTAGDTGLVTTASDHRILRVMTRGLRWFTAYITSYTGGTENVKVRGFY